MSAIFWHDTLFFAADAGRQVSDLNASNLWHASKPFAVFGAREFRRKLSTARLKADLVLTKRSGNRDARPRHAGATLLPRNLSDAPLPTYSLNKRHYQA